MINSGLISTWTLTPLRSPRNLSKAEQTLKGSTLNSLHHFKLEQNSLLLPHNLMTKQRPTQPGGEPHPPHAPGILQTASRGQSLGEWPYSSDSVLLP